MKTFLPKSKYTKSHTSGHEYIDPNTNQPYAGPIILTPVGAFKGTNVNTIKGNLVPISKKQTGKTNLKQIASTSEYGKLKPRIQDQVSSIKNIIPTKNIPSKQDYKRGHYLRYYVKRTNSQVFYEIDKKTHKALRAQNGKYDHNLYIPLELKWALIGNAEAANMRLLKRKEEQTPGISNLFPKLDEFKSLDPIKPINVQHTRKSGYRPEDSMHHDHGDLEDKPYIRESLPSNPSTYTAPTQIQEQITQVVPQPTSTPSTGGGSSGGGGGGY